MEITREQIKNAATMLGMDSAIVKRVSFDSHEGLIEIFVFDSKGNIILDENYNRVTATMFFDVVDVPKSAPF